MKDYYSYLAVISFDDDGISIEFPDLEGCFTCVEDESEIYNMAKEVLGLHLWSMEQDKEEIPKPSTLQDIVTLENQTTMLVNIFMPSIRNKINNQVIKKTLTIPKWLNIEAEQHGVNFSKILQEALKEHLNIKS